MDNHIKPRQNCDIITLIFYYGFYCLPETSPLKNLILVLSSVHTEILCENCLEYGAINSDQFRISKLFRINTELNFYIQLLQKPEILLSKLDMGSNLYKIFQSNLNQNSSFISEQIREVESQMKFLEELIQNEMQQFQKCEGNIKNLRKQILEDCIKGLNFDSLKQLLVALVQSKEAINPNAIGQLKICLHQFFFELQTNSVNEANNNKLHFISNDVNLEIQNYKI